MKLTARMTLLYTALSVLMLAIFIPVLYRSATQAVRTSMENRLEAIVAQAQTDIADEDQEKDDPDADDYQELLEDFDQQGYYVGVYDENGRLLSGVDSGSASGDRWIVRKGTAVFGGRRLTVKAAGTVNYWNDTTKQLARYLAVILPSYLLLGALGAWWIAHQSIRPVRAVSDTTTAIAEGGDLTKRLPPAKSKDEVGTLTNNFNAMLDSLEDSFQRERQFTSDASHELRTPVTVIALSAGDALETPLNEDARKDLEAIQSEAGRMKNLISQLLTLTRGYEGRLHFEPEEMDLSDMAASVCEVLESRAGEADIHLISEITSGTMVQVDQSLFTEVLLNLVENGIKYGKKGGHVWLRAEQTPDALRIHVSDDGIGMTAEEASHAFERFYRADRARDRCGSGLGLSIVRWIVEMHGGSVSVESHLGEGTDCQVLLPHRNSIA